MSNSDSFINEVAEEVRRDRLYGLARRYGWIVALVVVLIIGAAGAFEWMKARERASAEGLGDAILQALEAGDARTRSAALENVAAEGDAQALRDFFVAAELSQTDTVGAARVLRGVAEAGDVQQTLRDLAVLKLVTLPDVQIVSDERLDLLSPLTEPGAPFRLSALEQRALVHVERGEVESALADLETISQDVGTSAAMRNRALQLVVALGGQPDDA